MVACNVEMQYLVDEVSRSMESRYFTYFGGPCGNLIQAYQTVDFYASDILHFNTSETMWIGHSVQKDDIGRKLYE